MFEYAKREAYQSGHCWAQSILKYPMLCSPADWGWILVKESWMPMWTVLPEAAKSCHELVKCGCRKSCKVSSSVLKQIVCVPDYVDVMVNANSCFLEWFYRII